MTSPPPRPVLLTTASGAPLLGPLVRQAYRWYRDGVLDGMDALGLTPLSMAQAEFFTLVDRDGVAVAELARRARITRQSAHQVVRELAASGLVEVVPDPGAARRRLVRPTSRGLARVLAAQAILIELEEALAEQLGRAEVERMRALLASDWGPPGGSGEPESSDPAPAQGRKPHSDEPPDRG